MNVTMLLADSAQVAEGKLYILGGGWSLSGPEPVPSAVAIKVEVDTHEFDRMHHWELFLEDADGQLVQFESPDGPQTIEIRGDFSASAPDGVPAGTPVDVPIAVNLGPIPLRANSRFTWRLVIDGESLTGATASFTTRPLPDVL
ncbi:MAG: hypothetical protein KGL23_04160 [Acidobacteriota bacterium]|jgi:hypothetical protein|nr:hypothetical protein [Acidobacteriota bacterium]MDE3031275.1 hypothetical protein [Acidobacteriota bacterium]MDE3093228.1 hypothetical protein [Acidobacteriota bacterium]MDE3146607.1 hypothetical protein [Acidobacteriota bacterium]